MLHAVFETWILCGADSRLLMYFCEGFARISRNFGDIGVLGGVGAVGGGVVRSENGGNWGIFGGIFVRWKCVFL